MDDLLLGMNKGEVELYVLLISSKKSVFIFKMKDFSSLIFGNEDHKDL